MVTTRDTGVKIKPPEFSHPSVYLRVRVNLTIIRLITSTALRDQSFSWKHIVMSLEGRSISYVQGTKRLPLFISAEARVQFLPSSCWICVGYSGIETGCSSCTVIYPCHYYPHNVPYSSLCCYCSQVTEKRAKPGWCWTEKYYFHLLLSNQSL